MHLCKYCTDFTLLSPYNNTATLYVPGSRLSFCQPSSLDFLVLPPWRHLYPWDLQSSERDRGWDMGWGSNWERGTVVEYLLRRRQCQCINLITCDVFRCLYWIKCFIMKCVPIISTVMICIKSLTFYVSTQMLTLLVNSDTQAYRINMYIGIWQYCELRRTSMTFTGRFKNKEKLRPWP